MLRTAVDLAAVDNNWYLLALALTVKSVQLLNIGSPVKSEQVQCLLRYAAIGIYLINVSFKKQYFNEQVQRKFYYIRFTDWNGNLHWNFRNPKIFWSPSTGKEISMGKHAPYANFLTKKTEIGFTEKPCYHEIITLFTCWKIAASLLWHWFAWIYWHAKRFSVSFLLE